jgi:hypothetical protein
MCVVVTQAARRAGFTRVELEQTWSMDVCPIALNYIEQHQIDLAATVLTCWYRRDAGQ